MAKFGFLQNRSVDGIPLGFEVRKQFGHRYIFRVQRGNGFYNSTLGQKYQHKMAYYVPLSINNVESQPYRQQLIAAVHKWKNDLTANEKEAYNLLVGKGLHMSGYNLFMREAMKGEVQMFVDRGDPANFDFVTVDFTQDNAWHELDLSSIITLGAKLILFDFDYRNVAANRHIELRKNGQTNNKNHTEIHTRVAAQDDHAMLVVAPDLNRVIQYKVATAGWASINATVRGWWT